MDSERENLYRGLTRVAWGYFLLHVDFNVGTVSVLPAFAGYLLLIRVLSGERRDLALLRPLCILLAAWNGVNWLLSWAGTSLNGRCPPLDLIISAAGLYFHFQFLTDMAALAETYQPEGSDLNRKLLRRRTVYLVLTTAAQVILYLPAGWYEDQREFMVGALAVVLLAATLFIMMGLFELRRLFREDAENRPVV